MALTWICLGVSAGILSGLFGIGGGIILVPVLVYIFGFSQQQASGTSLVALLLPVGMLGVYQYVKSGFINAEQIRTGLWIALGMLGGAYLGARLAGVLDVVMLRRGFAILLAFSAIKIWFS